MNDDPELDPAAMFDSVYATAVPSLQRQRNAVVSP
jgi:hypothetical protein